MAAGPAWVMLRGGEVPGSGLPHPVGGWRGGDPKVFRAKLLQFMSHPKIQPIGDRILLQFPDEKEQIQGGLIIPDSAKEKPQEAKVIALGSGRRDKDGKVVPFVVKVGDTVFVAKYSGAEVKLDGKKFTIVREDDLLGVLA